MDPKLVEQLIGEQYKGKEKLLSSNVHALHLGRDWALQNLKCPIGLRVKKADKVGDRIFIEGNSAAALGAVYGGATVCAWYPITPSSSLADAFGSPLQEAAARSEDRQGQIRHRAGRGRTGVDRHRDRRVLERRARLHRDLRPRHLADAGVHRPVLFRRNSGRDHERAARRSLDRHADAHPAMRHFHLRLCLAWRHQACAAVSGGSGRGVRIRRHRLRSRRTAADHDFPDARSRYRHEPSPVPPAALGRCPAV